MVGVIAWPIVVWGDQPVTPAGIEFFEKKIRPLLIERCSSCHGADKQSGGLRLDSVSAIRAGGDQGSPIEPGNPDESLLIKAVRYSDQDFQMPPKGKIADEEIRLLEEWVRLGGAMPVGESVPAPAKPSFSIEDRRHHWAYQPVRRVAPPTVASNDRWENPIDLFLQSKREEKGLSPTNRAGASAWLRRVCFDLTGLPPTPTEVRDFQQQHSPDAKDRTIDRLLASPRYGERWARHWLDLVRFSETLGHEFDYEILNAWRYRDYTIRAFNSDLPYNQWVVEHVAGDLVDLPRLDPNSGDIESVMGTAFFWFGEATHSPVDVRQNQMDRIDNQIDVLTKTFLAQSVACARCHDHKFDAISQADYYALAGYLKSSRYDQSSILPTEQASEKARALAILVADRDQAIDAYLASLWKERIRSPADWSTLPTDRIPASLDHPLALWKEFAAESAENFATAIERKRQQIHEKKRASEGRWIFGPDADPLQSNWRRTGDSFVLPDLPRSRWHVTTEKPARLSAVPARQIRSDQYSPYWEGAVRSPTITIDADYLHVKAGGKGCRVNVIVDGFTIIRDPIYGSLMQRIDKSDLHWKTFDLRKWVGQRAYIEVIDSITPNPTDSFDPASAPKESDAFFVLEEVVLSNNRAAPQHPCHAMVSDLLKESITSKEDLARAYQSILDSNDDSATKAELWEGVIQAGWLPIDLSPVSNPMLATKLERVAQHQQSHKLPTDRRTPAMTDGTGEDEMLLVRGNPKTPADPVPRRFLDVFSPSSSSVRSLGSGRLELASQIADEANPLTARVMVNRLWKHHLGEGIVRSPDDFGKMGQSPTHPELLDWLACEFVERGWSLKEMHRLILASDAAQLSSDVPLELRERDPNNELLCWQEIRRLEGESIRDAILSTSGRLDVRMEGPSIQPMLTDFMPPLGRPSVSGPLDGAGRRSIYLAVRRNFLTPMLLAFDYPLPQTTIGRRNISNVPAQALSLLNDPMMFEQADLCAAEIMKSTSTTPDRIVELYLKAFGREPTSEEVRTVVSFLDSNDSTESPQQRWSLVCHSIMNAKEFIFVP
jgi:cytochrome c553